MRHDALGAHARDELGITKATMARPLQAAFASACSVIAGAALPLAVVAVAPEAQLIPSVAIAAFVSLPFLGVLAAKTGGAKILPSVLRVTFWSVLAMGVTSSVGAMFGGVA